MNRADDKDDITRRPLERMALIVFETEAARDDFFCAIAAFGGNIAADTELGAAVLDDDPCEIITMDTWAVIEMLDAADDVSARLPAGEPLIHF